MNLSADEITQKYAKHCGHCSRNTLIPYEHEWSSVSCGYNVIKRKHELSKLQRKKKLHQFNKYAENKIFCFCTEVYKIYEDDDFDKIFEA